MNLHDCITKLVWNDYLEIENKTYYYWELPRQCGATSTLIDLANNFALYNKKVLFISYRNTVKGLKRLNPNVETLSSDANFLGSFHSISYDLVLIENMSKDRCEKELLPHLLPCMSYYDGKIIHINTTEGTSVHTY